MKRILTLILVASVLSLNAQDNRKQNFPGKELSVPRLPAKNKVWVFIMAGQSNMAGRGWVEPQDTVPNERILTINKAGEVIIAKEPLHFYEPSLTGLDCGLSFGNELLKQIPKDISILLIPTAVGGSSISQWLGDSLHKNVKLFTNFKEKAALGMRYGKIKGILWHQGESDTKTESIPLYKGRLEELFSTFRTVTKNKKLYILIGELGSYSNNAENWMKLNKQIEAYAVTDPNSIIITTVDLKCKEDRIHFDGESQRLLGQRFAQAYLRISK
jgi:hypothetical protein